MFSIMAMAGKTSRISAASSGWRSMYSLSDGRRPCRYCSRNSSASSRTNAELASEADMSDSPLRCLWPGKHACQAASGKSDSQFGEPRNPGHDLPQPFDRPQVTASRTGLGHAQHLGDLAGAELFEVFQGQHFAVGRVHAIE